jgi:hypothetical protein
VSGRSFAALLLAAAALAAAAPARAHHGVAALGAAGPEGPGAALETTSPFPLAQGSLLVLARSELVPWRPFAFADPENKTWSSYSTLVLGYGVAPWLSAYVLQPFNAKAQDVVGTNAGAGDTALLLSLACKWDEGLRLVPQRESLDELEDWHFSAWASATIPDGPTTHRDDQGDYYEPEMQTGFGAPSSTVGLAAGKQVAERATWLADASWQHFFPHTYPFTRYQFGDEVRANTAAVFRAYARGTLRVDLAAELNGLWVRRDREADASGALAPVEASGGAILYVGIGARLTAGALSAALGLRTPVARALNESSLQQGSEGLEIVRATLTIGWTARP